MEQLKKPTLAEQFERSETLSLPAGTIEIIDLCPEQLKTQTPAILAPGWAQTPAVYRENLLALAAKNRRILSFRAPHGIETAEGDFAMKAPEAELRKMTALVKVLEEKRIPETDVVAHSEGALYATLAFLSYPEKFRNLVLVNPVGIIGPDNVRRLIVDFSRESIHQKIHGARDSEQRERLERSFRESVKSVAESPANTLKEILAISHADIRDILKELKKQGKGISIIHTVDDKVFPMHRAQKALKRANADGLIDGFYSVKGGHNSFYVEPEKYSQLVDAALDALENKSGEVARKPTS